MSGNIIELLSQFLVYKFGFTNEQIRKEIRELLAMLDVIYFEYIDKSDGAFDHFFRLIFIGAHEAGFITKEESVNPSLIRNNDLLEEAERAQK